MPSKPIPVLIDTNPGRSCQPYGIAREIGTDVELIHAPSIGVVGNKGFKNVCVLASAVMPAKFRCAWFSLSTR
jgi:hypothetical protein